MNGPWQIALLGGLEARQGDRSITRFRTRKTGALFAYLAYHRDRRHPREELIELWWPEVELAAGRNCLRVALSSLRRQLEPPGVPAGAVLQSHRGEVQLNPAACITDTHAFDTAIQAARKIPDDLGRGERLAEAISLYNGALLPGYYDDWILPERERLSEAFHQAIEERIALLERAGELLQAISVARRAVHVDPVREGAHRSLLRLLVAAGDPEGARVHYEEFARRLQEEIGEAPAAATRALLRLPNGTTVPRSSDAPTQHSVSRIPFPTPPPTPATLAGGTVALLGAQARISDEQAVDLKATLARHGGREVAIETELADLQRDPGSVRLAFAFGRATDARTAASDALERIHRVELRLALCVGEANGEAPAARSPLVARVAALLRLAQPGHLVASEATAAVLREAGTAGPELVDLGLHRVRADARPERAYRILPPGTTHGSVAHGSSGTPVAGSLPIQFTRFFGRESEICLLDNLLGNGETPRLVTLTGAGGCGKSRLAREVAKRLRERPDPHRFRAIWFVRLVDLTEARRLPDRILEALELPVRSELDPLDQVVAALSPGPTLLVLDNFEHLVEEGARIVGTLMERLSLLSCLITSRRRLDLPEEHEFQVAPLPVPDDRCQMSDVSERLGQGTDRRGTRRPPSHLTSVICHLISDFPSVQLFVDRAQAVRPDFQLTPANAPVIAALCARLEGIPLALELAAARAWALTPAQMLEQLARRLDFLAGKRQPADPRHQTMRAAIAWSFDLLPQELQRFLASLSIFRGGWTLSSAAAVCGEGGVLDHLERLRECSMIFVDTDRDEPDDEAETRFRMLETLREFAWEQLPLEDRAGLARRHAEHYLKLAETTGLSWHGKDLARRRRQLERERENVRAVLDWCMTDGDLTTGLRVGAALTGFWTCRGYTKEGQERLSSLLARSAEVRPTVLEQEAAELATARALYAAALIATEQGDYERTQALIDESLPLWRQLDNRRYIAASWNHLGNVANGMGEYDRAEALLNQALATRRELNLPFDIAVSHLALGELALNRGDLDTARDLLQQGLAEVKAQGEPHMIAVALNLLAARSLHSGEFDAASSRYEEALAMLQRLGDRDCGSRALSGIGNVALQRGDWETAIACHRESLAFQYDAGARPEIATCLEEIATAIAAGGFGPWRAARLCGAATVLRKTIRTPVPVVLREHRAELLVRLQAEMGRAAFEAARAEGASLMWWDASEEALRITESYASCNASVMLSM
jgi:predicted ATPase/DNA-binding SARP family transcriptional activator